MSFDEADESVAVEIGSKDPTTDIDAMTIRWLCTSRSAVSSQPARTDKDRLMVLIQLPELQRSRFYLDSATVTKVEGVPGTFRLWFHDAFYVGFSG